MRIGVDLDNTIICFDPLFYSAAVEKKLVPENIGSSKTQIHDYLQSFGRNDDWTRLQGIIYGDKITQAKPFPGVKEFFIKAERQNIALSIVSHKTDKSALPPFYDLHTPARRWLVDQGFYSGLAFKPSDVFFETSIARKLDRIRKLKCDYFIDDLLEFLLNPDFPANVRRVLFDPANLHRGTILERITSWREANERLLHE